MYFPKSRTVLVLCLLYICCSNILLAQELLLKDSDSETKYTFDYDKLDYLIKNDSLYKATVVLDEAIEFSKKNKLYYKESEAYNNLGMVFNKITDYGNSEIYFLRSLKINDSLKHIKGKVISLSGLLETYLQKNDYKKFDSLYPITQKLSKKINAELYFINLENQIKRNYYTFNNVKMFNVTDDAISLIKSTNFNSLTFLSYKKPVHLKEKLLQSFNYYNAISAVKMHIDKKEGYERLFLINETRLKQSLDSDASSYRKLATLNYYKYKYYTDIEKKLDSANKYLFKSDELKYQALKHIKKQHAKNGALISKIINTQQQLNLANAMRKKDLFRSKIFFIATISTTVLLLAALTVLYFYFKARKKIIKINNVLKATNERLIITDKNRLEFFSILSHELRTPIYGISGLATLIDQEKDETKRQSYLDSLLSSSGYLSILIDNILQANKLRFENKNLRVKPDKINKIINYVISTVKVAAKNKGLELKTNIEKSDENEFILIDKVAFSQILINLIYNAIRYTKEGYVSVNVFEKNRTNGTVTLTFEVEDSGIGIEEKHRDIVFSAFENKAFLHKNSSGSGLGLYIVKTLLKSHNSDIDFISKPNKGSTFFFDITFNIAVLPEIKQSTSLVAQRDMHILIVDDNKINLLITKKNVEKIKGYSCETLTNGKEAISAVKENDFDLILMDINMPEMDGYEVTKHIRIFNPDIPILALTALNSGEISSKAEEAGINHIITKPYIFEDFKAIITSFAKTNQRYFESIDKEAI